MTLDIEPSDEKIPCQALTNDKGSVPICKLTMLSTTSASARIAGNSGIVACFSITAQPLLLVLL